MADVRYVVLSDLHLGAENSMLTSLVEAPSGTFSVDIDAVSPVLEGLIEGLRVLTAGQEKRPTLVMAGDILDLALSPDEVSAAVFGAFARLAFGPDGVFEPRAYY